MVPTARPPRVILAEWLGSGQLTPESWMARLDEAISTISKLSTMQTDELRPYCTSSQGEEPSLNQTGFKSIIQQVVPNSVGLSALDAATPILWKLFIYVSRYPFFQSPSNGKTFPQTMTLNEFLRALVLLHADFSDQLFNGERDERTRARTNADHRRLLFQGLALPTKASAAGKHDETLWTSKAALRASRYWEPGSADAAAHVPCNMGVNRDTDGDECVHDLLDFMYALQPVEYGPPVPRADFIGVVKEMIGRGDVVVTPLQEFRLAKGTFEKFVELLLVMHLDGSQKTFKKLPEDFKERKNKVVAAFYGEADGKEEIDFLEFEEALSAGTKEITGGENLITNEFVSTFVPIPSHADRCVEPKEQAARLAHPSCGMYTNDETLRQAELISAFEWLIDTHILTLMNQE